MIVRDLSALKGKTVEVWAATYAGADGVSDKGVVTNLISGYDSVFIELDSKVLINIKHVRKIMIR